MGTAAWELIFMMLVLKLPILYLIGVVWWAVRSSPDPFAPAELVRAAPDDSPHDPARTLHLARSPPADPPAPARRDPGSTALSAHELDRRGPAETLAGYMSAAAIFLAVMALAYRPLVLALCALVLSLTATAIGGRWGKLHAIAVGAATVGFILGMSIAVVTGRPLF